jgi:HSP20 family protein
MALKELIPWRKKELDVRREEENPFHALQREMNRMMDRFTRGFGWGELIEDQGRWDGFFPSVDVAETDKEIRITAELPGMDEKDLDVSLSGNNLLIRGEKKAEKEEKGEHYFHKESSYGAFHRTIPLPTEVVEDQVEATFKKGVLKIRLPKSPEAQKARKKITIH